MHHKFGWSADGDNAIGDREDMENGDICVGGNWEPGGDGVEILPLQ